MDARPFVTERCRPQCGSEAARFAPTRSRTGKRGFYSGDSVELFPLIDRLGLSGIRSPLPGLISETRGTRQHDEKTRCPKKHSCEKMRRYCGVTNWCAMANNASSRRVETPVLSKIFDKCLFTVSSLSPNCLAMSRLLQPSTMEPTTSSSRA